MSPTVRFLIWLILYFQQGQGKFHCEIIQKGLIIVAIVNETVKIPCVFKCHHQVHPSNMSAPPNKPVQFTVNLYKDNTKLVASSSGKEILPTFNNGWELRVNNTEESGMYYCQGEAASINIKAEGMFLRVQNAVNVYVKSPQMFSYLLAGICVILALYCVSVTSIVLIKRKTCYSCRTHLKKPTASDAQQNSPTHQVPQSKSQEENQSPCAAATDTDNAYMALQARQKSVYCTLDSERTNTHDHAGKNKSPVEAGADAEAYDSVYESF
ncbi:uncharacterized protein LOC121271728 [Carcharodon carcharias]|uniref:uncharacterized protein LOC121271728 n=1 Tax=Carcharodon carcharias TaxID=13397 RepID=UPI001B7EDE1A|nr:uncharacterized protein LOC121271728 [Carcharodon carcharias]